MQRRAGSFLFQKTINFKQRSITNMDKMPTLLPKIGVTMKEIQQLKSVHNEIVNYLINSHVKPIAPDSEPYKTMVEYNVRPFIMGQMVNTIYKALADGASLTSENIKLANVMGWCYEALTGFIVITDDMTDESTIRRGQLPWYKLKDVGQQAINHGFILENSIYFVLSKYFGDHVNFNSIIKLFHETVFTYFIGQSLEDTFLKDGKPQLELYTMERFNKFAFNKFGYIMMRSSFLLASYLAGKYTNEFEMNALHVLQKMGPLLQANNDFGGCFDNRTEEERADTDVAKGRCTWLVVMALQKATPAQKQIIQKHYGRPGVEAETTIRNLYLELELPKEYKAYERKTLTECFEYLESLPNEEHRKAFSRLLSKVPQFFQFLEEFSEESGSPMSNKLFC